MMKYLIRTLLILLIICQPLHAEIIYETKDYGYQRKLSYLAFVYGHQLFNKADIDEKKLIARELSIMAFYYWMDSKRNVEFSNRGIEIVLKKRILPAISKFESTQDKLFLRDPFSWTKYDKPVVEPISPYKMGKEEYKNKLLEFSKFLNAPISKPTTRVREIESK